MLRAQRGSPPPNPQKSKEEGGENLLARDGRGKGNFDGKAVVFLKILCIIYNFRLVEKILYVTLLCKDSSLL